MQFYHKRSKYDNIYHNKYEFTAVCETPTEKQLLELVELMKESKEATISLNFGLTLVHPKEQYCYKIGREESLKKLKQTQFTLTKYELTSHHSEYLFSNGDILIEFQLIPGRKKPYLIYVS